MVDIGCRCGAVRGVVGEPSLRKVNRVICYCDDCQAFAHHLGRAELLDAKGGSDIVPLAPASLAFVQGHERIAGIRLSAKGVYRWYASCCHTPLGNTVGPAVPFVGLMTEAFGASPLPPDQRLGEPIGAILGQFAIGGPPPRSKGIRLSILLRSILKLIGWRLRGRDWPHPFFDRSSRRPIYPVTVLSAEQREALRPLCGPSPAR